MPACLVPASPTSHPPPGPDQTDAGLEQRLIASSCTHSQEGNVAAVYPLRSDTPRSIRPSASRARCDRPRWGGPKPARDFDLVTSGDKYRSVQRCGPRGTFTFVIFRFSRASSLHGVSFLGVFPAFGLPASFRSR